MFIGRDVLLDAGPLIALLDARDQWNASVREAWPALLPRLIVSEPAVVEATHMVAKRRGDHTLVLELLLRAEIPVVPSHLPLHQQCVLLMRQYADVPMDYADATIVALADRLHLHRVFTLDRKGFRTYRGPRGVALEVVPH